MLTLQMFVSEYHKYPIPVFDCKVGLRFEEPEALEFRELVELTTTDVCDKFGRNEEQEDPVCFSCSFDC